MNPLTKRGRIQSIATQVVKLDKKYGVNVDTETTVTSWNDTYGFVPQEDLPKLVRSVDLRVEVLRNEKQEPKAVAAVGYALFALDVATGSLDKDIESGLPVA